MLLLCEWIRLGHGMPSLFRFQLGVRMACLPLAQLSSLMIDVAPQSAHSELGAGISHPRTATGSIIIPNMCLSIS